MQVLMREISTSIHTVSIGRKGSLCEDETGSGDE